MAYRGKPVIHPDQIATVNRISAPPAVEIAYFQRGITAFFEAVATTTGAAKATALSIIAQCSQPEQLAPPPSETTAAPAPKGWAAIEPGPEQVQAAPPLPVDAPPHSVSAFPLSPPSALPDNIIPFPTPQPAIPAWKRRFQNAGRH